MNEEQKREYLDRYESQTDTPVHTIRGLDPQFRDLCTDEEWSEYQNSMWKVVKSRVIGLSLQRNWSGGATDHDHWSCRKDI